MPYEYSLLSAWSLCRCVGNWSLRLTHIVEQLLKAGNTVHETYSKAFRMSGKGSLWESSVLMEQLHLSISWSRFHELKLFACRIVEGCSYVIHTASPFPVEDPKDPEKEVIRPAVDGILNVLSILWLELYSPVPMLLNLVDSVIQIILIACWPRTGQTLPSLLWMHTSRVRHLLRKLLWTLSSNCLECLSWFLISCMLLIYFSLMPFLVHSMLPFFSFPGEHLWWI